TQGTRLRGRYPLCGVHGARNPTPSSRPEGRDRQVPPRREKPTRRGRLGDHPGGFDPASAAGRTRMKLQGKAGGRTAADHLVIARDFNVRRTELTCPAHSLKMMEKAAASAADEVILDLEDSCAVSQKVAARKTLVQALNTLDFRGKIRAFRPNNIRTGYFYRDVIEVLEAAGKNVDVVVIPKVYGPEDVLFADRLITQIEESCGYEVGRIKLEVLI